VNNSITRGRNSSDAGAGSEIPDSSSETNRSKLHRELSSWTVNGTSTRIHEPELLGNVEVVSVEDADAGAIRYIWKGTDLPLDGPRYAHFRVRLDPANTTSMMFRAAAPSNPSELIVDLATGVASIDQSNAAALPVVLRSHITSDFAEYLVQFPQNADATLWQLYPSIGPNGITNRNEYTPASVGKVYLEFLDTNASPEAFGNPLYQWFFDNYPILATERGSVLPYSGIEGMGVEFRDAGADNLVIIGDAFQINEPTFRVAYDIRKETNGNSFYVDLRDANNLLNRLVLNPTTGAYAFTGSNGGTASVRDDGDRWHVEIEFNVPLQGDNRIDFVSDWTAGGGSNDSNVLYDFSLFAIASAAPFDTSNDNYIDIGNKRMQWGVIDHLDNADGGTETFPAPFADTNYTLTLSLSESTSPIEGPSADVGINYWTENLTTTSFGHNRDNDIDFAHIHWMAIGDKP